MYHSCNKYKSCSYVSEIRDELIDTSVKMRTIPSSDKLTGYEVRLPVRRDTTASDSADAADNLTGLTATEFSMHDSQTGLHNTKVKRSSDILPDLTDSEASSDEEDEVISKVKMGPMPDNIDQASGPTRWVMLKEPRVDQTFWRRGITRR